MKEYYQIHEISKLYGIGMDSLRYYEKIGVLHPYRAKNGYRMYRLKNIYQLNILSDLRRLGFSMKQIKAYLHEQSIEKTLTLLREEQALIQKQLESLRATQKSIRMRVERLESLDGTAVGRYEIKAYPDRFCVRLHANMTRDEETDFAIQRLHRKHEDKIRDLGNQSIGAMPSMEAFERGAYDVFDSVFFILEQRAKECDFVLPKGDYLSRFYRGSYQQSPAQIRALMDHARASGLERLGNPFELYPIDNRYTMKTSEFLTEIQMRVQPPADAAR